MLHGTVLGSSILIVIKLYTKTIKKSVEDQTRLVTKKLLMINFTFILCVTSNIVLETLEYTVEEEEKIIHFIEMFETLKTLEQLFLFTFLVVQDSEWTFFSCRG